VKVGTGGTELVEERSAHPDERSPIVGLARRLGRVATIGRMAHRVTLIPGDGIGPELAEATTRVLDATGIGFEWESVEAGEAAIAAHGTPLPDAVLESVRRTAPDLGPITTPVAPGSGRQCGLRQALGLYANLRPPVDERRVAPRDVDPSSSARTPRTSTPASSTWSA
jgi:hypothetical protein